ncbi:hypothetical protein BD779DRAFT_1528263 [Infundibulicybe gibba]|nr:hypothetical protein BD779DRAFT_1528263 [Infundibulicybe gibba]
MSQFFDLIASTANQARSDDISSLKWNVLEYVMKNPKTESLTPPIPMGTSKGMSRGFRHLFLARLLCPRRLCGTFDENPKY